MKHFYAVPSRSRLCRWTPLCLVLFLLVCLLLPHAAQAQLIISQPVLDFGRVTVGASGPVQFLTVTNSGNDGVTVNELLASADYAANSYTCGALPFTIAPGVSCLVAVTFTPMAVGLDNGTLNFSGAVANFYGVGIDAIAAAALSPTFADFQTFEANPPPDVYNPSGVNFYLRNTGTEPLTFPARATVTGDYQLSADECSTFVVDSTLPPGETCILYVNFVPTTTGLLNGVLTVNTSAGVLNANLTGTGAVTLPLLDNSDPVLSFDEQAVNTTSPFSQGVNLFSTENFTVNGTVIASINDGNFTVGPVDCPSNNYCGVAVWFTPKTPGYHTGTVTITSALGPINSFVSGYAPPINDSGYVSPETLVFGPQVAPLCTTPNSLSSVLTNTGTSAMLVGQITGANVGLTSDFKLGYSCSGQTVASLYGPEGRGNTCGFSVNFTPLAPGLRTGALSIPVTYADGSPGTTFAVNLTGTGVAQLNDAVLSPIDGVVFSGGGTGNPGFSQQISLTNSGNAPFKVAQLFGNNVAVGSSTTGAFSASYDGCSNTTVVVNDTCYVNVVFLGGPDGNGGSLTFPVIYACSSTITNLTMPFAWAVPIPPQTYLPAPMILPGGGSYSSGQMVTLTDAIPGAVFYYTTDGSIPNTNSTLYTGPITVSSSETISAIATASGYSPSPATTAAYLISPLAIAGTLEWTWMGGSNTAGTFGQTNLSGYAGVYGTLGVAAAGNIPGGRVSPTTWTDSQGNLWLFGGLGFDANGTSGNLNDVWMFNPATNLWAWMGGSSTVGTGGGQPGIYGTLGTPSAGNIPGGRYSASVWIDGSGNVWLFGGGGYDASDTYGALSDLWEFSPSANMWTWKGGSDTANQAGVYGTLGTPSASNNPGGQTSTSTWIDNNGNFWLLGSDFWVLNPSTSQWTWMGGVACQSVGCVSPTTYGTLGVPAPGNFPGSRGSSSSWTDSIGNFWLFGGYVGSNGAMVNDTWEFNPSTNQWTWMGGSNGSACGGQGCGIPPTYGTEGIPGSGNNPGARVNATNWVDSGGNLWLFGGNSNYTGGNFGNLNDLWEFNTSTNQWTWMGGNNSLGSNCFTQWGSTWCGHAGVYGIWVCHPPRIFPEVEAARLEAQRARVGSIRTAISGSSADGRSTAMVPQVISTISGNISLQQHLCRQLPHRPSALQQGPMTLRKL